MRYTQEAMNTLRTARENNPNVSQRRFARNIYTITSLDRVNNYIYAPVIDSTSELYVLLGRPTEFALAHLIRRIDTQVRKDAVEAATVTNSATPSRRKARNTRTTRARGRKVAGNQPRQPLI